MTKRKLVSVSPEGRAVEFGRFRALYIIMCSSSLPFFFQSFFDFVSFFFLKSLVVQKIVVPLHPLSASNCFVGSVKERVL